MKVLQINSVCGTGSTGKIVFDLHNYLESKGDDSYIAYGRGLSCNCNNTIKIGTKFDHYTHAIGTRIFDKHGFGSITSTRKFIEVVRTLNPDIIHLHNIHGYYINIEVLFDYLRETNIPVVWTLHDCWSITGHCVHFDHVGCNKWMSQCYDCPQKNEYPCSYVIDNSKSNYKRKKVAFQGISKMQIVTPSDWLASVISCSFLSEYQIRRIYNGLDIGIFKPSNSKFRTKYELNGKLVLLGVASVWETKKGINDFLELAKKVSSNCVIVLVGVSKKQLQNLPSNIIGIKRTDNLQELAEIYTEADFYLNLSVEETMGMTTIESMACGTPVIAYDATAIPEIVTGETGFIVPKNDINAILKLIETVDSNRAMKEKCIKHAELFSKNNSIKEYLEVYNNLLIQ